MSNKMNEHQTFGLAGRYRIEVKDNASGKIREYEFNNIILDAGLDALLTQLNPFQYFKIVLGTSNAAVAPNQSGLQGSVAEPTSYGGYPSYNDDGINNTVAPYWRETTMKQVFQTGISGTFREIGFKSDSSIYLSRALISDNEGNPVDLVVNSSETLTVYYTFRIYPPMSDATGTLTIGGTETHSHNYVCRGYQFFTTSGSYSFSPVYLLVSGFAVNGENVIRFFGNSANLKDMTAEGMPGAQFSGVSNGSSFFQTEMSPYTLGSFTAEKRWKFGTGVGNGTDGIKIVVVESNCGMNFAIQYTPNIMKTSFDTLELRFRLTLSRV